MHCRSAPRQLVSSDCWQVLAVALSGGVARALMKSRIRKGLEKSLAVAKARLERSPLAN